MPEVGEVTLELLQAMADRHQRATAEQAVFIINPSVWNELFVDSKIAGRFVEHPDLGEGYAGPNYRVFSDMSVLREEVEIVK